MSISRQLVRKYVEKNGIDPKKLWPFVENAAGEDEFLQTSQPAGDGGKYSLYMDHTDGAVFLWPTDKRVPSKLNPNLIARGTEEELLRAISRFCSSEAGYYDQNTPSYPYVYQDHALGFNWPTGTLAGVAIAMRVIEAALDGRVREAWDIGKAYENKVERAMDPDWWESYDAAMAKAALEPELDDDEPPVNSAEAFDTPAYATREIDA